MSDVEKTAWEDAPDTAGSVSCCTLPAATRILIADDDPIFRALAASVLGLEADNVVLAKDGAEAMYLLEMSDFDMAIVDLSMPKVDGFRLIAHIRNTPKMRHLPIVVVTTREDREAIEHVHSLGVDLYLNKPLNWDLFPFNIQSVLKRSQAFAAATRKKPAAA